MKQKEKQRKIQEKKRKKGTVKKGGKLKAGDWEENIKKGGKDWKTKQNKREKELNGNKR